MAGDDEFDRWTEACAKCGQRDQLGEEVICCEQPTGADPNARDAKGFSPLMWTVPDAKDAAGQIEQLRFASALMLQHIKEICSNCNCKRKICRLGANRFKSS